MAKAAPGLSALVLFVVFIFLVTFVLEGDEVPSLTRSLFFEPSSSLPTATASDAIEELRFVAFRCFFAFLAFFGWGDEGAGVGANQPPRTPQPLGKFGAAKVDRPSTNDRSLIPNKTAVNKQNNGLSFLLFHGRETRGRDRIVF